MIQPPMQACHARRWQTFAAVLAASVALLLPGFVAFSVAAAQDTATGWLESFHPVVYLKADSTQAEIDALKTEIKEWPAVGEIRSRKGADAVKDLEARLGAERVRELGVTSSMLPPSIVIVPETPVAGHVDLIARVAGLEAREAVETVNVPDSTAVRILSILSLLGLLGAGLGLLGLLVYGVVIAEYLSRLQREEQAQNDVLLMFGAHSTSIRKPALVRGVFLGVYSGGLATVALMTVLAIWQGVANAALGSGVTLVHAWPVAVLPLVVGPVVGLLAGFWISAPRRRSTQMVPRLLTAYGV